MLTIDQIVAYVDELIDEEARVPKDDNQTQRAIATGVILALEDFKEWLKEKTAHEKTIGASSDDKPF